MQQKTLAQKTSYEGVGLFLGNRVKVQFLPAEPNTGVKFVRADLPKRPSIPVALENVVSDYRRTCLEKDGVRVEVIEHLLSALAGLSIDNLEIIIDAVELPGTDGSAQPWVTLFKSAGIKEQDAPKKKYVLKNPVSIVEGDTSLVALPPEQHELLLDYTLQYSQVPLIGTQHFQIRINEPNFIKELAPARTFCTISEVESFKKQGLGKGGNYGNTLVVDGDKVVDNKLRFKDEFVRHKLLDLLGDLYLLNTSLQARIIAIKTGHEHNLKLVQRIARLMKSQSGAANKVGPWLDIRDLQKLLPHRYPFLLIDKIIELEGYKRAVGIKNVTINEPFFQGHFPDRPIMPGVLQLEAMAQLAGALLLRRSGNETKLAVLLAIDKVKLRKSVVPGDQLRLEAETIRLKARTGMVYVRALVDGEVASEAELKFMLVDNE